MDGIGLPNDGICPWCQYDHGPRFGRFVCDSCGGFCADNDLVRNIDTMPKKKFYGSIFAGFLVAGVLILVGLAIDGLISLLPNG